MVVTRTRHGSRRNERAARARPPFAQERPCAWHKRSSSASCDCVPRVTRQAKVLDGARAQWSRQKRTRVETMQTYEEADRANGGKGRVDVRQVRSPPTSALSEMLIRAPSRAPGRRVQIALPRTRAPASPSNEVTRIASSSQPPPPYSLRSSLVCSTRLASSLVHSQFYYKMPPKKTAAAPKKSAPAAAHGSYKGMSCLCVHGLGVGASRRVLCWLVCWAWLIAWDRYDQGGYCQCKLVASGASLSSPCALRPSCNESSASMHAYAMSLC